ncbi:amino acid transporter [Schizopora paradoxa]|uniref:Amino acid transporter n=1 Tax=Schizopora paradoxa TaxID=27342 RepID=A0A0H2S0I7_9AGAM|nr:amino acid transporter [Schizopora paradoxa]
MSPDAELAHSPGGEDLETFTNVFPNDEDEELLGAPVEKISPLGHQVTLLSCVMLNLGQILGSGIFSTPGVILNSVGSVGMLLLFWIIAPIFCFASLAVYSELASMFPNRSGAEVVYLEQAYPRPKFLVPISFAVTTVLLSFSATNSIVFAQYFMTLFDIQITSFRQSYIALSVAGFSVAVVAVSTKWSLRAVNAITLVKVLSNIFVALTGVAVLLKLTKISQPFENFRDPWADTSFNGNSLATALVKTHFAYVGWGNAFNVLGEVRSRDPVQTVRNAGGISLFISTVLFVFTNIAYVAAIPKNDIMESGQLVGALFFQRVFGESWASKILPLMVIISCLGNLIAVTVGHARVIREVARQGLLPYPEFFASTRPFGTPLGPVALKFALTALVIFALPARDAFNFLLDLASYPNLIFAAATAIGVWILRKRRAKAGMDPTEFKASDTSIVLYLLSCVFLLVMPWIPPEEGHADVSFWYATYCVVGIGIILLCGIYYWIWVVLLPKLGGYEIIEEVEELPDGARIAKLVRRYVDGKAPRDEEDLHTEQQPLLNS